MTDAIIAEAQRRLFRVGKHARMRLSCTDILALAGVEQAKPVPAPAPEPEPTPEPTPEPAPEPAPEPTPDLNGDEDVPPYEEWSKTDLVAECEAREIAKSGNKDELVARLTAHDEAAE